MLNRSGWATAAFIAFVVGLALVSGSGLNGLSGVETNHVETGVPTPLFERRLLEAAALHAVTPKGHQPSSTAPRRMASAQQAFIWGSEAVSGCLGSACVASGCPGSVCAASGCTGSGCAGTACVQCNRPSEGFVVAEATGGAFCPLDEDAPMVDPSITGLEVATAADGIEVRFAASGPQVAGYRVSRLGAGQSSVLLAEGRTTSDQLIRVVDRSRIGGSEVGYAIEVIDAFGRITRTRTGDEEATQADHLAVSQADRGRILGRNDT